MLRVFRRPFETLQMAGLVGRPPARAEVRSSQIHPWGDWGGTSYGTTAGMNVSQDSALNLLAVFGCVQLISDTIATLPRHVYRATGPDQSEEISNTPRWFEQPNPNADIVDFIVQTLASLLIDGNAYWVYGQDLNRAPTELFVLDPTTVDVRARGRTNLDVPSPGNGSVVEYFVRGEAFGGNLLHLKGLVRPGALKGMSPVESARQSIGMGLASQQFGASFYANGITPSGMVTTDADLSQEQATALARQISQSHGGPYKSSLPMILDNGATWTPLSVTPEQAQFLGTRQFTAAEIAAQMFLVDPSMLGIAISQGQNLTYANLEQRGIHLVQYTLMRWLVRLERAFTALLPRPQYMKFNVDAITRADLLTRYQAHRIALGPTLAFETVNEVRDLEDMPPTPDGDTLNATPPAPPPMASFVPAAPSGNGNGETAPV